MGDIGRGALMDPRILAELASASPDRLRRISVAAAAVAIDRVGSVPPSLQAAVTALQNGKVDQTAGDSISKLADDLDRRYLELHDDEKPGGATPGWEAAFRLARAAAAVSYAYDPDPMVSARESVYETLAAVDDTSLVVETVIATR